ncbi:MAG: hypothetical protein ACLGQX_02750 [Acidobacteriota bacterium]
MLLATSAVGTVLSSPSRYGEGRHSSQVDSYEIYRSQLRLRSDENRGNTVQSAIAADVETAIGQDLATVNAVQHVLTEHAEGSLLVWVVADRPSAEVREKIFEKQFAIIDAFPDTLFDFNLVSSSGRPSEISSSAKVIFTREG